MDTNVWTSNTVINAITNGNPNLEMVLGNYFKGFIVRVMDSEIHVQGMKAIEQLYQKVLEGIESLEVLRKEFLNVVETFAVSNHPLLKSLLPAFFEKLLNTYDEKGINLFTGTNADVLRNDHFRFFNQFLFISITKVLLENQCFETLQTVLHARFKVYCKSYGVVREVNFIRYYGYNYTLNEFLNTESPKRISKTADYIRKFSSQSDFVNLIKTDILLYYTSLWHHSDDFFDTNWFPELSVYNHESQILPYLVSKAYFEKAKVLFDVKTIDQYRALLDVTQDTLERSGLYRVPTLKTGLLYDTVGSMD